MAKQVLNMKMNWKNVFRELILIVAGILIALYINNLNENRKDRIFERKIVAEIESSLERDLVSQIETRIARSEQIIEAGTIVLSFLKEEIPYHDSLQVHFWRLNWVITFEPQSTSFERLKSKGIEVLRNEELRTKLLTLYDYTYPRLEFFVDGYNEWTIDRIEPFVLIHFEITWEGGRKGYKPIDPELIQNSIEYQNLVLEKTTKTNRMIGWFNLTKSEIEEALEAIQK